MIRVVLLTGCFCLVLSLGVLPLDWRDRAALVVDVFAVLSSSALVALTTWRIEQRRRGVGAEASTPSRSSQPGPHREI